MNSKMWIAYDLCSQQDSLDTFKDVVAISARASPFLVL